MQRRARAAASPTMKIGSGAAAPHPMRCREVVRREEVHRAPDASPSSASSHMASLRVRDPVALLRSCAKESAYSPLSSSALPSAKSKCSRSSSGRSSRASCARIAPISSGVEAVSLEISQAPVGLAEIRGASSMLRRYALMPSLLPARGLAARGHSSSTPSPGCGYSSQHLRVELHRSLVLADRAEDRCLEVSQPAGLRGSSGQQLRRSVSMPAPARFCRCRISA